MSKLDFPKLILRVDALITNYKLDEAREILANLWIDQVPDQHRAALAQLCRRSGLNRLGLKFVHTLVHESKVASTQDYLEYASCLRRAGLHHEALRIFKRHADLPAAQIQSSFCHIQHWDYAQAAAILVGLAEKSSLSAREARVVKVNLVSSLIFLGEMQTAQSWLNAVLPDCQAHSPHLYINALELQTQIHLAQGDLARARGNIALARPLIDQQDGTAQMLLEKWEQILNIAENPTDDAIARLGQFREHIRRAGHWESLRSMDWEVARVTGDERLAAHVYFGTPYMAFRRHVLSTPFGRRIPHHYIRVDSRWDGEGERRLVDGVTGENMLFKFGTVPYRVAMLLFSDFYQPWTIYRIFDGLFPDEAFNPFSSPKRLYRLLERARAEIQSKNLPLEMQTSGNGFRLRPKDDGAVVVYETMCFRSSEDLVREALHAKFLGRPFSVREAAKILPLSTHQSARAIRKLVTNQDVEAVNSAGKSALYRLKVA